MGKLRHHFDHGIQQTASKNLSAAAIKVNKKKKEPIKVTYISSPMMVKASNASEFRAIVQELTGKNSHVSDHHDVVSSPTTTTTTTTMLSNEDESSLQLQAVDQGRKNHHHGYLMDNIINMSLLDHDHDQFDERFLWSEIFSAECNSFGF